MSMLRVLLVIPIIHFLLSDEPTARMYALLYMFIAAATDYFDGFFARRFQQVSDLGKILDPLADKTALVAIILILAFREIIPQWFASLIIARDILIVAGSIFVRRRSGHILQSTITGKITVTVIAVTVVLATAEAPEILTTISLWLSVIFTVYSLLVYARRAMHTLKFNF